jgi:hypothetical protein
MSEFLWERGFISVLKRIDEGQMGGQEEGFNTEDTEEEHRGHGEAGGNPRRGTSIHFSESGTSPS